MVHLRTLGGLSVAVEGGAATGAAQQRKTLALLALLASAGRSGISRDRLMVYLWPEADAEHARALLKQACYALRRDLRAHDLFLGATELRLNPAVITSDVQRVEDALQSGDPACAVNAYGGPFLDGFHLNGAGEFEEWVERERARVARRVEDALESLAAEAAARGDHRTSAGWWRRLTELNPLSARAAIGLMAALDDMAEPAEAIRHGQWYAALVRAELGVEPGAEVSALIRLQNRTADRATTPSAPAQGSSAKASRWEAVVSRDPSDKATRAPLRWYRLPAPRSLALVLSLTAVAGAWFFWRTRTNVTLDPGLVAVAPFDALPPDLEPWREGLPRVLSGHLDVAGLRVVAPTAVMRMWQGRTDPEGGAALGRRTGARLVVFGQLLGAGRDSVRLTATLLDAETKKVLAVTTLKDAAHHVDRLSDSLVGRILDQVGPIVPNAGPQAVRRPGRVIAGAVLGPDGQGSICDFLPYGSVVEARLLNAVPPPRQGGFDAFACPESHIRLSVSTPGHWFLRLRLPATPVLGTLPLNHIQATPMAGEAGDLSPRIVVGEGSALGGGATLEGRPVAGVALTVGYETHRVMAANGASGPDGRWVEFFGRSPLVLQNGVRYVVSPACMFLGTRIVSDPPAKGFLFPSEVSSIDCALVTAPTTHFTHDHTRLIVTPMPGDIGGLNGDFARDPGYGWGVQFPIGAGQAPSHDPSASHLYQGGLLIGIEPDRILSGVSLKGMAECSPSCRDLSLDGAVQLASAEGSGKRVTWQYSDDRSPRPIGLRITQVSFDGRPPADYVLFRFTITNGGPAPTTFYAGFGGDWDVGENEDDDVGFTAMGGRLMYQANSHQEGPFLGTLLAGDAPVSGNFFYRVLTMPSRSELVDALTGRTLRPTSDAPGDNHYVHGAGPIRLDRDQRAELWIAVVAGETRRQLLASADQAAADIAARRRVATQ